MPSLPAPLHYRAPLWLPGGNVQTLWSALCAHRGPGGAPALRRERWTTPDGDFIDVDWRATAPGRTLLVLFHGLEGSSASHYAQSFADFAHQRHWNFAVPHFRGCSGELNLAPRAYHCGDHDEVHWILQRFRARHQGPILALGVSLGGNALLRWAEELEHQASALVSAVAAVSAPMDMHASGRAIGQGFNWLVYTRMFLRSMKPRARAKLAQHPGLFDGAAMEAAQDLYDFDDAFTAPLHGFKNAQDYWTRASAKPQLQRIRVPTLVVNARNDPFVPHGCLPQDSEVGANVSLWQPEQGGHVGFPAGGFPGHLRSLPQQVGGWLARFSPDPAPTNERHYG
jgi:predicted alpha/beta-fold hydrolase